MRKIINRVRDFIRGLYQRPEIPDLTPIRHSTFSFTSHDKPLSGQEEKELLEHQINVMVSQNHELRISNQHTLNILWRNQILTLFSIIIALTSAVAAILSVIFALAKN